MAEALIELTKEFEHLHKVISSERFLKCQGLGNEVPFFIYPFKPTWQFDVKEQTELLIKKLKNEGLKLLEVNLYDLGFELLDARGITQKIIDKEPTMDKSKLLKLLQGALDVEQQLVPAIGKKAAEVEFDVMLLTGVGEVFPYIRSHNILNNLQSTLKEKPTIMMFPGEYCYSEEHGSSLNLFGTLLDDKYYRAFNIKKYQI